MAQSETSSNVRVWRGSTKSLDSTRILLSLARLYARAATIHFAPDSSKWCPSYARWFCLPNCILRTECTALRHDCKPDINIWCYYLLVSLFIVQRARLTIDVLIRLMAIGEDHGERHRNALSRLATGDKALRGTNYAACLSRVSPRPHASDFCGVSSIVVGLWLPLVL